MSSILDCSNTLSVDLTAQESLNTLKIFFVLRSEESFRCLCLVDWCVLKKRMEEIGADRLIVDVDQRV